MIYLDEVLTNETQNIMKIKKELLLNNPDKTVKELFPELFEVKLEAGKWYKNKHSFLFNFVGRYDEDKYPLGYGIDMYGNWSSDKDYGWGTIGLKEASGKEVEAALIEEAKRRGYKQCYSVVISDWAGKCELNNNGYDFDEKGHLWLGDCRIFVDGVWAEIIKQKEVTKEEIAQAFNTTVGLLKIID